MAAHYITELRLLLTLYVFPVQFVIGVIGNLINLWVLLDKKHRTRTNLLLACISMCDLGFLVFMAPVNYQNSMPEWDYKIYVHEHVVMMANWMAAASVWLGFAITVSMERYLAITYPLKMRYLWTNSRLFFVILTVFLLTLILWLPDNFTYDFRFRDVVIQGKNTSRPEPFSLYPTFVKYMDMTQVIASVLLPIVLLSLANVSLLVSMHRSKRQFDNPILPKSSAPTGKSSLPTLKLSPDTVVNGKDTVADVNNLNTLQRKRLQSIGVTVTVCLILISATVAYMPSAIVYLWTCIQAYDSYSRNHVYYYSAFIANSLVTTGKVANFFLFCFSSSTFRGKTRALFSSRFCIRPRIHLSMSAPHPRSRHVSTPQHRVLASNVRTC